MRTSVTRGLILIFKIKMKSSFNENKITNLKFLPAEKQTWAEYMGTYGDSAF
jgi:hypothetical protein